jgi:choline-phosphate cytidylyltransferase
VNQPIVYTVRLRPILTLGTFDVFHRGHDNLLARASGFGRLIVGVNSDNFVEKYKGQFPVETQLKRIEKVYKHWAVDDVFLNDGPGIELIRQHKPELLVIGSDWHDKYLPQIGITAEELFVELNCGVVYLPRTIGVSSTELRNAAA